MKKCKEIRERLSAFIDNELPVQESRLIEKHLLKCPACVKEVSSLRQVVALLDIIPDESPSRSFTPATLHRASSWKRCAYVKRHILIPALTALRSVLSVVPWQLESNIDRRKTPFNGYLHSFDDFPPESLSSVYISLIQGEST
jgi:anti-sigma factor RsiW